jgi:glycosyltransferase involved in cell wall biosynthesis
MTAPVVSIVTPCLNSGRFLHSCLMSVCAQDYPHVEHVVQDGNSTDGSVELLRSFPGNVQWVSEPDGGQADALDKALARIHGDIVLVLNADDELLPGAASWAVEQMQQYPGLSVIYGDVYLMDVDGIVIGEVRGPVYDFPGVFCVEKVIPAQAAFIRVAALQTVGLRADTSLDTCPDYEMFVRLGLRYPMQHVPRFVAKYRYYHRPMDGSAPRTVERFIRAKETVIQRVLADPETPIAIKQLNRRAKAGLHLWASEEAQGIGDPRGAWLYYADALAEFGPAGAIVAWLIRLRVRLAPLRARPPYPTRPSARRALAVGKALLWERQSVLLRVLGIPWRGQSRARSALSLDIPLLVRLLFLLTVLYALVVIASRR